MTSRRDIISQAVIACPAYFLLGMFGRAIAGPASPAIQGGDVWLKRQQRLARMLRHGEITPEQWQTEIEAQAQDLDLTLLAEIKRAELLAGERQGSVVQRNLAFMGEGGRPTHLAFEAVTTSFDHDSVIPPHGHKNIVTAHLIIEGALRIRTFDRISDESDAVVIRPTSDRICRVGDVSTMSSGRDNVHWFVSKSLTAKAVVVRIPAYARNSPAASLQPLDPVRGEKLQGGDIRAPRLRSDEAAQFYTHSL